MTSTEKRAYWQQHLENWQQSQLPQKVYCQQNNLSYASFGYWRTRLKRTTAKDSKLIPVNVGPSMANVQLYLPGGIRLELPAPMLAEVLPIVYQSLQEVR